MFIHVVLFFYALQYCAPCPMEYSAVDPYHSFCSQPYPGVKDLPLSSSDKAYILGVHNRERRQVYATNMEKMYWNNDLAEIALRHARQCRFEHDQPKQRIAPKIPLYTGQNVAMGYANWTEALNGWIEEKQYYSYGYPASGVVGHYTQIIWHSTTLVGCASTLCPAFAAYDAPWKLYICNYVTGQLNNDIYPAYDQSLIKQPLRDCKGKVCLYNGTLDLDTCKCKCSSYATGSQCEHLNCDYLPPCPYFISASCIAVNVPLECPQLCGLCERYETLKYVYGTHKLAPNSDPLIIPSSSATKTKPNGRKLNNKFRNRISNAQTPPQQETIGDEHYDTFIINATSPHLASPTFLLSFLLLFNYFILTRMCLKRK